MRSPLAAAVLLVAASLPAAAQDFPKLKPGLWEMSTSSSRRTGGGVIGSCSMPVSAPCRASVRPHFNRRHRWVIDVVNRRGSERSR